SCGWGWMWVTSDSRRNDVQRRPRHHDHRPQRDEFRGCDPRRDRTLREDAPQRDGRLGEGAEGRTRRRLDQRLAGRARGHLRPRRLIPAPAAGMQVQILDQGVSISSTSGGSADLRSAVMNSTVVSDTDEWTFQLPLFYNGESGFTTLRPSVTGVIL